MGGWSPLNIPHAPGSEPARLGRLAQVFLSGSPCSCRVPHFSVSHGSRPPGSQRPHRPQIRDCFGRLNNLEAQLAGGGGPLQAPNAISGMARLCAFPRSCAKVCTHLCASAPAMLQAWASHPRPPVASCADDDDDDDDSAVPPGRGADPCRPGLTSGRRAPRAQGLLRIRPRWSRRAGPPRRRAAS